MHHVTDHFVPQSDKMSAHKRPAARVSEHPPLSTASMSSSDYTAVKKGQAANRHFNIREMAAELQSQASNINMTKALLKIGN